MDTVEYVSRCCGHSLNKFFRTWGRPVHSWAEGYQCRKCSRVYVPHVSMGPLSDNGEGYQIEVNALRALLLTAGELDITD